MKRFSIVYKLALAIAFLITVSMALLGMVVVDYQTRMINNQSKTMGSILIGQFTESAKDPILSNDSLQLELIVSNLVRESTIKGATIFDKEGKTLTTAGPAALNANFLSKIPKDLLNRGSKKEWQMIGRDEKVINVFSLIYPVRFQKIVIGYVALTIDRSEAEKALSDSSAAIRATTFMMIALVLVISFIMVKSLAKPVYRLVDGLTAIVNGELEYRITEKRNDEIGYLMETFNKMAEGLQQKAQVENVFSRFVSTNVAKRILSDMDNLELGGRHVYGSVLFADIVGFTSMSENMEPSKVVEFLNEYFSFISQASELSKGSIDKYMGDCAMVTFGVPEFDELHSFHAIACCVLIQKIVKVLNYHRVQNGLFPVQFKIGVNSGEMLAGYMGSAERLQYTVVGDAVNLASRLCSAAGAGQILVTEETYTLPEVKNRVVAERHGSISLKGKANPVDTYLIKDLAQPYRQMVEQELAIIVNKKRPTGT